MKNNWQTKKLGEVCDIVNGSTPLRSNKEFWDTGDVSWFTVDDIREQGRTITYTRQKITKNALEMTSLRMLPPNSVLLCCTASVGEYAITKIPLTTNQQFNGLVIKNKEELDPFYVYYFSATLKEQLFKLSGKATIDFIPISRLKDIVLLFPPLPEQKRIVRILDEVFEGIEKAKANAEKNLANTKELFESYLQSVFANSGKAWKEEKLEDIAEVFGGFAFKSNEFKKEGKYQVLRMGNVRPGLIRADVSPVFIEQIAEKDLSRALLKKNDIIITQTGTRKKRDYGYTVIINEKNYLLNQRLAAIRFSKEFNHKFFLYFSWSNRFRDQFFANETGTVGQGNVGIGAITGAVIPVPTLLEQNRIVSKLGALSEQTKKLEAIYQKKLDDLEELKKSILKNAFEGEL